MKHIWHGIKLGFKYGCGTAQAILGVTSIFIPNYPLLVFCVVSSLCVFYVDGKMYEKEQ